MLLQNVRLAFPEIWRAVHFDEKDAAAGKPPKYSCTLILPVDHPQIPEINTAIEAAMLAKWADKQPAPSQLKEPCLRNGATKAHLAGFDESVVYLSASNDVRPTIVDRNRTPLTERDGIPYAGCYVDAIVSVWCQDNQFGKRVNCEFSGLQFRAHGESFGGGGRAADPDEFGMLEAVGAAATELAEEDDPLA